MANDQLSGEAIKPCKLLFFTDCQYQVVHILQTWQKSSAQVFNFRKKRGNSNDRTVMRKHIISLYKGKQTDNSKYKRRLLLLLSVILWFKGLSVQKKGDSFPIYMDIGRYQLKPHTYPTSATDPPYVHNNITSGLILMYVVPLRKLP